MRPDEENKSSVEPKEVQDDPTDKVDTGDLGKVPENKQLDHDPGHEEDTALGDSGDDSDNLDELEDGEVVGEDELQ